ncbi:uncharacterized protein LOC114754367 [Neltuma alba]|uniref:uncharacterized protein LOC114754367 n=1 Tax=Neltuma alba TaxID=207710 RepID=UPI0010A50394|nr:uncharacterized protein LOC114754367 [Prosopis alba]
MAMALESKNKIDFVNKSISCPVPTDPLYLAWRQCNNLVISWINRCLSSDISQSVLWINTAYDLWLDLADRFSQNDASRIAEIQEEMFSLRQGDLPVGQYFTKLKILWDELQNLRPLSSCTCEARKYLQQDYTIRFLRGLNDRFTGVKSQIMLMDPIPGINRVCNLVLQQEREMISESKVLMENRGPNPRSQSQPRQNNGSNSSFNNKQ